jgi:hypothetical protein
MAKHVTDIVTRWLDHGVDTAVDSICQFVTKPSRHPAASAAAVQMGIGLMNTMKYVKYLRASKT